VKYKTSLSPSVTRSLYYTCILSRSNFSAEIWWMGQKTFTKCLQTQHNATLCCILNAFCSTLTIALHNEATLPPVSVHLQSKERKYVLCLLTLPPSHPIIKCCPHHSLWKTTSRPCCVTPMNMTSTIPTTATPPPNSARHYMPSALGYLLTPMSRTQHNLQLPLGIHLPSPSTYRTYLKMKQQLLTFPTSMTSIITPTISSHTLIAPNYPPKLA
jgi:hypothetical protein